MLIHLSQLYRYRGEFSEAENRSQEALEISSQINDRVSTAHCLMNLGFSLSHLAKFEETRTVLKSSVEIYRDLGNQFNLHNATYMLGLNEIIGFGHLEEAEHHLINAQTLAIDLDYTNGLLVTTYALATIMLARGNFQQARDQFHKLLKEDDLLRSNLIGGMILSDLAFAENQLRNLQIARQYAYQALELTEKSHNFIVSQHTLNVIAILLAEDNYLDLAIEVDSLIRLQHPGVSRSWYFSFLRRSLAKRIETLSLDEVEPARSRGQKRNRWRTVRYLMTELLRMGWATEENN